MVKNLLKVNKLYNFDKTFSHSFTDQNKLNIKYELVSSLLFYLII